MISVVRHHPNWAPLSLTHIAHNKEAISQLHMCMDDLTLYSDRLGYMNQAATTTLTWPPNTASTHCIQYK